jgi:maleate isomerase
VIRIGVLTPHAAIGPEEEFSAMAPGRLVTRVLSVADKSVTVGAEGNPPSTPLGLRALTAAPLLGEAARTLAGESVDVVGHASTTSGYVIGFDEETAMASRLSELLDVPVATTCASAVLALRALDVERVTLIGAAWFDSELNELGAAYFGSQGFDVVSSASADLSHNPRRIDPAAVCSWTLRHVGDDTEGVFIGGNGFRAARAIEGLESAMRRPVLTSNQVLLWSLLTQADAPVEITGYGRLFAHKRG